MLNFSDFWILLDILLYIYLHEIKDILEPIEKDIQEGTQQDIKDPENHEQQSSRHCSNCPEHPY